MVVKNHLYNTLDVNAVGDDPNANTDLAAATTTPKTTTTPAYEAERVTVEPGDTVEGRIDNIVNKNSPIMQRAATRAKQAANSRGLLNTSMAVEAGQAAVLDAAMPIASQDAQTSFAAKQLNQNAGNRALELSGQTEAQSRLMKEKGEIDLQLQSADAQTRERLLERQGQINTELQVLRGEQSQALAQLDNESRMLLQANQSAGGVFASTSEAISNILAQPDINAGTKQQLIQHQLSLLQNGLSVIGRMSNLNLTDMLVFGSSNDRNMTENEQRLFDDIRAIQSEYGV